MYSFCNFEKINFEEILNIIQMTITFADPKKEISKIYECFNKRHNFTIVSTNRLSDNFKNFKGNNFFHYGVDFPVWYWKDNRSKKVMLIGQDPLRNDNDFNTLKANIFKNIIIGTPYAVGFDPIDLNNIPDSYNRIKPYWEFIRLLIENYNIYINDIYKLFFRLQNQNRNNLNSFKNLGIHKEIFQKEIELYKPNCIIFLGKGAPLHLKLITRKTLITNAAVTGTYNDSIPYIILPHLSGKAQRYHANFLERNNIKQNCKIPYGYYCLVKRFLNSL